MHQISSFQLNLRGIKMKARNFSFQYKEKTNKFTFPCAILTVISCPKAYEKLKGPARFKS